MVSSLLFGGTGELGGIGEDAVEGKANCCWESSVCPASEEYKVEY